MSHTSLLPGDLRRPWSVLWSQGTGDDTYNCQKLSIYIPIPIHTIHKMNTMKTYYPQWSDFLSRMSESRSQSWRSEMKKTTSVTPESGNRYPVTPFPRYPVRSINYNNNFYWYPYPLPTHVHSTLIQGRSAIPDVAKPKQQQRSNAPNGRTLVAFP